MAEGTRGLPPAEDKEISRLYDLGLMDAEIAGHLGWSVYYVRKWRRDHGKKPNRIWTKPDNMKPKAEREKIKAQKEADEKQRQAEGKQRTAADTSRCVSCAFWSDKFRCCDYLFLTRKRRPCKPGRQCVVYQKL